MRVEVLLPQWGMGINEGEVVKWLKAVGDHVAENEPLVEIETAKTEAEVEAPVAGVLVEIKAQEGAVVPVSDVLAIIESDDA